MKLFNKVKLLAFTAAAVCYQSSLAQTQDFEVEGWVSSEFHPMSSDWYTNPWPESLIPRTLDNMGQIQLTQMGATPGTTIDVDPNFHYQTMVGLGASLEHTTVYAIRKNKTEEQQREVLRSLIDPNSGIGMNFFRVSIGTSDFADGTRATPAPGNAKGWYSYQDTPTSEFSIERDRSLGIIDTVRMAVDVGIESGNELKILASAWSPPRWMREGNNMVGGGPLKADMLDDYAAYLRKFVEAYGAEGIPIYALTMQNERQFEPGSYPGMIITWQMERDLLIEVYENFHNIGGDYGPELDVKLWTLDHNFNYWEQAKDQMDSFKALGKDHYVDATAFHHYGGDSADMGKMHDAHPDKDVVFTEGTLWGLSADGNRRSYEALIRHLRHWATGYLSWVTMTTQTLDEANQGPYNGLGAFDPTLLVKYDGNNPDWYRTPEYWLMGQFSKFVKAGAVRIESNYGSLQSVTNVAFLNPDGYIVLIVANSTFAEQEFDVVTEGNQIAASVPARSIATFRWKAGLGQSPHPWAPKPEKPQDPFSGNPKLVPGVIQAEDYDLGGQNVAYSDNSFGNNGGAYREESVDIQENATGFHIGWLEADEWLEYSVDVSRSGAFDVVVRSASDNAGGRFYFEVDGERVSPDISTSATGGWDTFVSSIASGLQLTAGKQVLRLVIVDGEFNIDRLEIVDEGSVDPDPDPSAPCADSAVSIPGVVLQAEAFCASHGIQIESTTDESGGNNIGWIDSGDWSDYGITVATSGSYALTVRIASEAGGGHINFVIDGAILAGVDVPNTGGWQNWQSVTVPLDLQAGTQTLRLAYTSGGLNVNWISITEETGIVDPDPDPSSDLQAGTYVIMNSASGKALDVAGVSTSNGANVQQWESNGDQNQQWIAQPLGDAIFELVSLNSGACLDADAGSDNAHQWQCAGNDNQKWMIEAQTNGTYTIKTFAGGEWLEVSAGSASNGANVQTRSGSIQANNSWIFSEM